MEILVRDNLKYITKRITKKELATYLGKNVKITLDNGTITKGILEYADFIASNDCVVKENWFVLINKKEQRVIAFFRYSNVIKIKELK